MASTYTLNVTATDIINALKARKSILIHMTDMTDDNERETFIAPAEITFNSNEFMMRVLIPGNNSTSFHFITFSPINLNSILTANYNELL